jgi:hypothetical protein
MQTTDLSHDFLARVAPARQVKDREAEDPITKFRRVFGGHVFNDVPPLPPAQPVGAAVEDYEF